MAVAFIRAIIQFLILMALWHFGNTTVPTEQRATFMRVGKMSSTSTFHHLSTELDPNSFQNTVTNFENQVRQFLTSQRKKIQETDQMTIQHSLITIQAASDKLHASTALFQKPDQELKASDKPRNKRQLFALFSSVVGLGMSFYNLHEINILNDRLDTLEENENLMATVITQQEVRLNKHEKAINDLTSATQQLASLFMIHQNRMQILNYVEKVERCAMKIHSAIDEFIIALTFLADGRLSPTLFDPETMQTHFQLIITKSNRKGLTPLTTDFGLLYRSPISVVLTFEQQLKLFIHVPLLKRPILHVYRYTPIPFMLPTNKKVQFEIRHPKTHLAIDSETSVFREMTDEEMRLCRKEQDTYYCEQENILQKNEEESCLYSLFSGLIDTNIFELCDVSAHKPHERFLQTGVTQFTAFFPRQTALTKSCDTQPIPDNVTRHVGLVDMTLTPGCSYSTSSHTISIQDMLKFETSFHMKNLSFQIPQWSGFHNESALMDSIAKLHALNTNGISIKTMTTQLRNQTSRNLQNSFVKFNWWHLTTNGIILVLFLFILGIVLFFVVRRFKLFHRLIDPLFTFIEDNKSDSVPKDAADAQDQVRKLQTLTEQLKLLQERLGYLEDTIASARFVPKRVWSKVLPDQTSTSKKRLSCGANGAGSISCQKRLELADEERAKFSNALVPVHGNGVYYFTDEDV